jgi:hypothetical protein
VSSNPTSDERLPKDTCGFVFPSWKREKTGGGNRIRKIETLNRTFR